MSANATESEVIQKKELPEDATAEQSVSEQSSGQNQSAASLFFKDIITLVFSRLLFYIVLTCLLFVVEYPDTMRLVTSYALLCVGFVSALCTVFIKNCSVVLRSYIRISLAVIDTGIITILLFISGSPQNSIIIAYPLLSWTFSLNGAPVQFVSVFLINMCFYFLSGILFFGIGLFSFNIYFGIGLHSVIIAWTFFCHRTLRIVAEKYNLSYRIMEYTEQLISNLPQNVAVRLQSFFQTKIFRVLEREFRTKIEYLVSIINAKEEEVQFFKDRMENMSGEKSDDDEDGAVNEINSLLEMENLSLKEANSKLTEANQTLEEQIKSLSEELEIANSELERVYSSMNEESPQP